MTTFPRRNLRGHFATPVRSDGWHDSDLSGQASAATLAALGATGVYTNGSGVAFGTIDGVAVLLSSASPARYQREFDNEDCSGFDYVTADDDWTHAVVTRTHWAMRTGGFLRVTRMATAVEALAA